MKVLALPSVWRQQATQLAVRTWVTRAFVWNGRSLELKRQLLTSQKSPQLLGNRLLWKIPVFLFPFLPETPPQKEERTDIETPPYFKLKKHNPLLFLAKLEKCFWLFLWIYLCVGNLKKKMLTSFRCLNPVFKVLSIRTLS